LRSQKHFFGGTSQNFRQTYTPDHILIEKTVED